MCGIDHWHRLFQEASETKPQPPEYTFTTESYMVGMRTAEKYIYEIIYKILWISLSISSCTIILQITNAFYRAVLTYIT